MLIKLAYRLLRVYWYFVRPVTLGVRILLIKEGKFILVKHSYQDAWYLPGGGVKRGETFEQAIRREAEEECGAILNQVQFVGAYDNLVEYKSDHITLFLSEDFTLNKVRDNEIERVSAFTIQQLPENISPGSRRKIEAYINENLNPTGMW
jgi:8-oxo-dGTP pyrophosphatase MutT (NUDIX family)